MNAFGFMQGRLSNQIDDRLQHFPENDWRKEFKKAYNIGFKSMEWIIEENYKFNPIFKNQNLIEINNYLKKNKLKLSAICCDFFMFYSIFKKKNFNKNLNLTKEIIFDICPKLKVNILTIPFFRKSIVTNNEELLNVAKFINLISEYAKKFNVIIAIEVNFDYKKILDFFKLIKNKDCVGINYDTGNSKIFNFSYKSEINSYGHLIKHVHIKDVKNKKSVPLGCGEINFKDFFFQLKKKKYKGDFILQTYRNKKSYLKLAFRQLRFIKKQYMFH